MNTKSGTQVAFEAVQKFGEATRAQLKGEWEKAEKNGEVDQAIFALVKKGWVEKIKKPDGYVYKVATGAKPEFEAGRVKKRPYHRRALVVAPKAHLRAQPVQQDILEEMARKQQAVTTLQNTAAMIRFSEILNRIGPDQAMMMLTGVDNMTKQH